MPNFFSITAVILLSLTVGTAHAYGGGSSSGHCDRPLFSEFQPAANKYLQSFDEFSLVASSNTTPSSIEITISAGQNKYHFTAKELQITPHNGGRLDVSGKLDRPLQHGFVRLSVTAHSKPGCEKTEGYLIRIQ